MNNDQRSMVNDQWLKIILLVTDFCSLLTDPCSLTSVHCSLTSAYPLSALAPETISRISLVMAVCRALL